MFQSWWNTGQRILLLALTYWFAGQMARLMAIPPGYATAVWPAAGIALAGVLLWGWQVFPGVVLGSMLVNVPTSWSAASEAGWLHQLGLPFGIGCGAALQAVIGAALVRRLVGFPNPFIRERDIGILLLVGGPISCVTNATLAVLLLWLLRGVPAEGIAFQWWTWWGGDVIGVFLVTPIALLWLGERSSADWPRRAITVTVPLVVLAILVVGLFLYANHTESERQRVTFEMRTQALASAFEARLGRIQEAVFAMRQNYGGHPEAGDRARFERLAQETLVRRPGIFAFTWATRIKQADRADFENRQRQALQRAYHIRELDAGRLVTAGARADYFPICYRVPHDDAAFGFDVASEPQRREALRRAGESGEPIASGPIPFTPQGGDGQENAEKAILMFLAAYRDGFVPEQVNDRADAVVGYVIAVLKVTQFVDVTWRGLQTEGIDCWFLDNAAPHETRLALFRRGSAQSTFEPEIGPGLLTRDVPVKAASREWTLRFAQTPTFTAADRSLQPWSVLAGGMLFTGLLGNVLLGVTGRSTLISSLVQSRTTELAQANTAMTQEINERKQVEEMLRASEERFRQLVEGTRDYAILMLDQQGKIVSWNTGAQRINGYDAHEIIGKHWSVFHAPEDVESGKRKNVLEIAQREGRWEDEGWRIRKNGARFWANVIITPLHDSNGQMTGFLKITRDITERKRAETDLEESRRLVQRIAETMPSFLYVYDLQQQRYIFLNHGFESILGFTREEAERGLQAALTDNIHPDDLSKLDWAAEQYQVMEDADVLELEYRMRHANGDWRWLRCRNTIFARDPDGSPRQILSTALDITERKWLEQEVVEIAAKEQRRIGQELHDGTGQELTGLCMLADNLADALRDTLPAEEKRARRIAHGLRQTLTQVRALSRGLIPVEVDAEGLMSALAELADRVSNMYSIRCVFECAEPVPVEDNYSAIQLYRIAQEAITNAIKHGQARQIRVSLEAHGYYIILRISDDGIGMPATSEPNGGMGLRIMRYRAGQIGAQLSVRAGQPRGTIVACTVVRGKLP